MRRRYRFSIRGLMTVIVLLAGAFAALRYPSRFGPMPGSRWPWPR